MDIKKIISEVVREVLPDVLREVVRGELGMSSVAPSKRAAKTSLPLKSIQKRRPALATENGVEVGQKWAARSYTHMAGRTIEIVGLGKEKIMPKVLKTTDGRRAVAKPISYGMLMKTYDLVK